MSGEWPEAAFHRAGSASSVLVGPARSFGGFRPDSELGS